VQLLDTKKMTWIGQPTYHLIGDRVEERRKVVLHEFTMSDCEDPELYAAQPIYEWQQTEIGKWCMENATDLQFHTNIDHSTLGYRVVITGVVSGKHLTYFLLKKS
jgi:hypothetical protein